MPCASSGLEQFLREENGREHGGTRVAILLAGVRPDTLKLLRKNGFDDWFPAEQVFPEEAEEYSATLRAVRYARSKIGGPPSESAHVETNGEQHRDPLYYLGLTSRGTVAARRDRREDRGELIDEFVRCQPDGTAEPGADGLTDATDDEVRERLDPVVGRPVQCRLDVLTRQHREQRAGLLSFTDHRAVGQLRTEHQSPDPGVKLDGSHDVGHGRAVLCLRWGGRDCRLGGGGEPGHHHSKTAATNSSLSVKLS